MFTIGGLDVGTRTYARATEEWKRQPRLDAPSSSGQVREKYK